MWSPTVPIAPEAQAKHDSFYAKPVAKPFPAVVGLPSSTFEVPKRKFSWALGCWPKAWGFAVPPESWRSSLIPSGGGWPRPLCIASRSAKYSFGILSFPRSNFVKPHGALRLRVPSSDENRVWAPKSPAMAAGISDHLWNLEELLCHKA